MYVCMYVCVYVCMYVCMYVNKQINKDYHNQFFYLHYVCHLNKLPTRPNSIVLHFKMLNLNLKKQITKYKNSK